ncbi:MAG: glutathione S-transferase N-terminal domain-containing protein [Halieaceae bacterium]|jgi:glutathione S-transferase|nr:glutathione S-transferase N-terminal domain-containing protein [Halieaceae bacterium]
MQIPQPVELIGSPGSPYTRKMLALLRYRRIPYRMIWGDPTAELGKRAIPAPRLVFLPTFLYRDDTGNSVPRSDSTPIIRELEQAFGGRSVVPADPALAFIDYLLEDFADEWCTKYMFHYRWHFAEDADNAGSLLPTYMDVTLPADNWRQFKAVFSERQVGRLRYVGSNDDTAPVIDASYRRLLRALENHFAELPFLLGRRPGAGDFALFGQFSQLVGCDPTPRAIAHDLSMRTVGWTGLAEDLSGLEPVDADWHAPEALPASLREILVEIGRVYVPALLANARAVRAGEKHWQAVIDGKQWSQQAFPYQAKCLGWINQEYRDLGAADRARVDALLAGTGCENMMTAPQ